jgi:hypothetical protein
VGQLRLYPVPGERSAAGFHAYYFLPGQELHYDSNFPDELGGQLADANDCRERHRVTAWVDAPTPVLGAKLRHELEHARQYGVHGKLLFDLNDLIGAVLTEKLDELLGGGMLYNANPQRGLACSRRCLGCASSPPTPGSDRLRNSLARTVVPRPCIHGGPKRLPLPRELKR